MVGRKYFCKFDAESKSYVQQTNEPSPFFHLDCLMLALLINLVKNFHVYENSAKIPRTDYIYDEHIDYTIYI